MRVRGDPIPQADLTRPRKLARPLTEPQDRLPHLPGHGITAYLQVGGTLENAQAMAAHESPRTTKLYDRTSDEITLDEITLDEVERIVI
jgi:hypothetical protein